MIREDFRDIDSYAERVVEQCGDVLRGAKFMDGNFMLVKHLVVLLMRTHAQGTIFCLERS